MTLDSSREDENADVDEPKLGLRDLPARDWIIIGVVLGAVIGELMWLVLSPIGPYALLKYAGRVLIPAAMAVFGIGGILRVPRNVPARLDGEGAASRPRRHGGGGAGATDCWGKRLHGVVGRAGGSGRAQRAATTCGRAVRGLAGGEGLQDRGGEWSRRLPTGDG
ncbi:hypothetical protein [Actinomyces urogenitalis]|uniref:hypothetical protein n=1 Tax=Actinomyces urogenitalis TaxID=103621 RepID=UPI00189C530E|nr:hypothetical protein [Actinomyces urogenitalis]MDK8238242.1 hypothetical protein [Actinomyces urogenitalis]WOO95158.1 hypothetical protein R3I39_10925 [Actinomyces urogenitalis]